MNDKKHGALQKKVPWYYHKEAQWKTRHLPDFEVTEPFKLILSQLFIIMVHYRSKIWGQLDFF